MPKTAFILVSIGNSAYTNPESLSSILLEASKSNDDIYLIIGDSLRRWNILTTLKDEKQALSRSVQDGDLWCANFMHITQIYTSGKLREVIRWENIREGKEFEYKQNREKFDKLCSKTNVLKNLQAICEEFKICSMADWTKSEKQLARKKGELISSHSPRWEDINWDNAMTAGLLEYALRHFKEESCSKMQEDAKQCNATILSTKDFKGFLVDVFFPNAFEHQAEETTGLYFCLPKAKRLEHDVNIYYPNVIAPILRKGQIWANDSLKGKGCIHWNAVKVSDSCKPQKMVSAFFQHTSMLDRSEKRVYSNLAMPLVTAILNSNGQKRGELVLCFTNLLTTVYMWSNQSSVSSTALPLLSSVKSPEPENDDQERKASTESPVRADPSSLALNASNVGTTHIADLTSNIAMSPSSASCVMSSAAKTTQSTPT